jgi:hypothetical protein
MYRRENRTVVELPTEARRALTSATIDLRSHLLRAMRRGLFASAPLLLAAQTEPVFGAGAREVPKAVQARLIDKSHPAGRGYATARSLGQAQQARVGEVERGAVS